MACFFGSEVAEGTGQFTRCSVRGCPANPSISKRNTPARRNRLRTKTSRSNRPETSREYSDHVAAADARARARCSAYPAQHVHAFRLCLRHVRTREDLAKYSAEVLKAPKPADAGPASTHACSVPPRRAWRSGRARAAAPKPRTGDAGAQEIQEEPDHHRFGGAGVLILAIVLIIVLGRDPTNAVTALSWITGILEVSRLSRLTIIFERY